MSGAGDERTGSDADGQRALQDLHPALAALVGGRLGDYTIRRAVGHGSMGVVYEAVHEKLGRKVALKVLPPGLGATEKAIRRFLREAQAVAQLSHENIVPIYEVGEADTTHYYAMQFLEGGSLDKALKERGPLEPRDAAAVLCTTARAIHFAHQRGIIHRDIKPANLVRDSEGKVVVTDFGLARPERGASLTDSGAMVGTPLYMSPEQVRGQRDEVDRSTDVYSLGATLYELLVGEPPFTGSSTQEILQKILEEEPRPLRARNRSVPAELEVITLKALEKRPRHRYRSALEMAQDLERFLEGEPILARRASLISKGVKRVRKYRTVSILSLLVAVISLTLVLTFAVERRNRRRREFDGAMLEGQRAYGSLLYTKAVDQYQKAVDLEPRNLDALLSHARALLLLGTKWNQRLQDREAPSVWTDQYGSPEALYQTAREEVKTVLAQRPEEPLGHLCYSGLLMQQAIRAATPEERTQLFQKADRELRLAEDLSEGSPSDSVGEGPREIISLLLEIVESAGRDRHERMNPFLQRALTVATRAITSLETRFSELDRTDDELQRQLARLHLQRSRVFRLLFQGSQVEVEPDLMHGTSTYLVHAGSDAQKAKELWPESEAATLMLDLVKEELASATSGVAAEGAPPTSDPSTADDPLDSLKTYLISPMASDRTEALESLLDGFLEGGKVLTGIGGNMFDQILQPPDQQLLASSEDRQPAQFLLHQARQIMAPARLGRPVYPGKLEEARAILERAIEINSTSAEYHYELAFVCQHLRDLDQALQHSQKAVDLAPTNPLFLEGHSRLLLSAAEGLADDPERRRETLERAVAVAQNLVRLYGAEEFQALLDQATRAQGDGVQRTKDGT